MTRRSEVRAAAAHVAALLAHEPLRELVAALDGHSAAVVHRHYELAVPAATADLFFDATGLRRWRSKVERLAWAARDAAHGSVTESAHRLFTAAQVLLDLAAVAGGRQGHVDRSALAAVIDAAVVSNVFDLAARDRVALSFVAAGLPWLDLMADPGGWTRGRHASDVGLAVAGALHAESASSVWIVNACEYVRLPRDERPRLSTDSLDDALDDVVPHAHDGVWLRAEDGGLRLRLLPTGRPDGAHGIVTGELLTVAVRGAVTVLPVERGDGVGP